MAVTIEKQADQDNELKKLNDLIKDVRIAMMTTVDDDGSLRSRPMATQEAEFDGDIWFFTYADSGKVHEVQADQHVNVSYADPGSNTYVSVSGRANLVRDQEKNKELWKPILKTWFPKGLDDPNLALLKVHVHKAEYWDAPNNTLVHLYGFIKSAATGKPPHPGENKEVILDK